MIEKKIKKCAHTINYDIFSSCKLNDVKVYFNIIGIFFVTGRKIF